MQCPNCKTQDAMRTTTVDDGNGKLFTFCDKCPRADESQQQNFPTLIVKRGRGRPRKDSSMLNQRLSKIEESNKNFYDSNIQRNRLLAANTPRATDTDINRYRDALDRKRATCVIQAVYNNEEQAANSLNTYLKKKFDPQLGEGNWKIVGRKDALIIAEAIN